MDKHIDLYLIRHGQSQMNESGIINGQLHDPLNALGHAQAQSVGKKLHNTHFDAIWSSPLDRARETAEAIIQYHPQHTLQYSDDLKERSFGIFEGKPTQAIRDIAQQNFQRRPSRCYDRINDLMQAGIECDPEVASRFFAWASTHLATTEQHQKICIVTHGAFIRCVIGAITHIDCTRYFDTFRPIENTAISILRRFPEKDKRIIITLNDHAHLESIDEI